MQQYEFHRARRNLISQLWGKKELFYAAITERFNLTNKLYLIFADETEGDMDWQTIVGVEVAIWKEIYNLKWNTCLY